MFPFFFRKALGSPVRSSGRKFRNAFRPRLESLEDRTVPTTWTVNAAGGANFTTISAALSSTGTVNGDIIQVAPGTYAETLLINKQVTIEGAKAGQNANTRFSNFISGANGPKADPTQETVLTAPAVDPSGTDLIRVTANNVTIDGLVIDGNNPSLPTTAVVSDGVMVDARRGITNTDNFVPVNNLVVQNDIIQNVSQRGVSLNNGTTGVPPSSSGNLISGNVIRNFGVDSSVIDAGIVLFNNAYADVKNNTITDVLGQQILLNMQNFSGTGSMTWSGNVLTVNQDSVGITVNNFYANSGSVTISGNTVNASSAVLGSDDQTWGIYLASVQTDASVSLVGNTIGSSGGQFARGIDLWNLPTTSTVSVSNGSVGHSVIGIDLDSVDPLFGAGSATSVNVSGVVLSGDTTGVRVEAVAVDQFDGSGTVTPTDSVNMTLTGLNIQNATTGVLVRGYSGSVTATVTLLNNTIANNTVGIEIDNYALFGAATTNNQLSNNGTDVLDKRATIPPTTPTTPPTTPTTPLPFVDKVYRDLLGTTVDPSGEAYWTSQLNAGASHSQVAYQIETTPPVYQYYGVVVAQQYELYLHRNVDPSGFSYGVNFLAGGGSIEQLAASILGSAEYFQVRGGGSNAGFLTAVYADALNRAVDSSGAAGWEKSLQSGVSRSTVAYGILTSTEGRGDQIASYYESYLHRAAMASELLFWEGQYNHGATDQQVIANILGSPEYLAQP